MALPPAPPTPNTTIRAFISRISVMLVMFTSGSRDHTGAMIVKVIGATRPKQITARGLRMGDKAPARLLEVGTSGSYSNSNALLV
jgi:hypothetical protein